MRSAITLAIAPVVHAYDYGRRATRSRGPMCSGLSRPTLAGMPCAAIDVHEADADGSARARQRGTARPRQRRNGNHLRSIG